MASEESVPEAEDSQAPKVTDKRRIDPETGEVRQSAQPSPGEGDDLAPEDLEILEEASRDLVAEYRDRAARAEAELANFRSRVERDRQANREAVIVEVMRSLLPAIDDLDRAESHGDLQGGPLELVAQKIRQSLERFGLERVGVVGEEFDPAKHDAVARVPASGISTDTVAEVIECGYTLGEKLVRPARVAVSVPEGTS